MFLTHRFNAALEFAVQLHANQVRKSSGVPYTAHLLGVTALVLEAGGDEDQAIAALLHDAVEDQGGRETLRTIQNSFGKRVAWIVEGCTDAYTQPKPPWRERKQCYLDHLPDAHPDVRLVSVADKLHNARSILRDLLVGGNSVFAKFKGGKDGTLWYYNSLVAVFQALDDNYLVHELSRVVNKLNEIAADNP